MFGIIFGLVSVGLAVRILAVVKVWCFTQEDWYGLFSIAYARGISSLFLCRVLTEQFAR
jgi:hypothetical protein